MPETATTDITATVDAYIDMWNEEDAGRRAELISRAWSPDGTYLDPMLDSAGPSAISEMVAGVHSQFPGHRFRRTTGVDLHHDRARFGWELSGPDGSVTVAGIDVAELAADGRLRSITGFFGDMPPAGA